MHLTKIAFQGPGIVYNYPKGILYIIIIILIIYFVFYAFDQDRIPRPWYCV